MIIKNALCFTESHQFEKKYVKIEEDKITVVFDEIEDMNENVIDAEGKILIPGLIDLHFHGCNEADFTDGTVESIKKMASYELQHGILNICPATMTISEEQLLRVMKAAHEYTTSDSDLSTASLIGINLEGPFISEKKLGAQNPDFVKKPEDQMLNKLQEESGSLIKIVCIAPEEDDTDFIKRNKDKYVLSLAHTVADFETADKGFKSGIKHVTHLFNAMNPIHHRNPGPIPAALLNNAEVEVICDNVHLHEGIVKFIISAFSEDKIIFVSDSIEATGIEDGSYHLGGLAVTKKGRKAVLTSDMTTLAGSVTNLYDCMKVAVKEMNIPLEKAVLFCTENPAKSLGYENTLGKIKEGYQADLLLVDSDLNIHTIIHQGKIVKGE